MAVLSSEELRIINDNWHFLWTVKHDPYEWHVYRNTEVDGLRKVAMMQVSPPLAGGTIICNSAQSTAVTHYGTFSLWLKDSVDSYGFTEKAHEAVNKWRAQEAEPEPEPEPPPEETPDLDPIIDDGDGLINGVVDNIKGWIQQAILAGLEFLDKPLQIIMGMMGQVQALINTFAGVIETALGDIITNVMTWFETIADKIKGVINEVWDHIEIIWLTLQDMFNTVKDAITHAFETSWIFIKETLSTLWIEIQDGLKWIGEKIVDGIKYIFDKVSDGLSWAGETLNNAYIAIKDTLTAVWDRTKQKLTDLIDSIQEGMGDAVDRITLWWEGMMEARDERSDRLENWTEEKIAEFIKTLVGIQRRVLEQLADEG